MQNRVQTIRAGIGEFRINTNATDYQEAPFVAALSNGGFVVSWDFYEQHIAIQVLGVWT